MKQLTIEMQKKFQQNTKIFYFWDMFKNMPIDL